MVSQLMGFWKQLDNMQETDKQGYKEFIEKTKKNQRNYSQILAFNQK